MVPDVAVLYPATCSYFCVLGASAVNSRFYIVRGLIVETETLFTKQP